MAFGASSGLLKDAELYGGIYTFTFDAFNDKETIAAAIHLLKTLDQNAMEAYGVAKWRAARNRVTERIDAYNEEHPE